MGEVGGDQRWEKASQAGSVHEERIVVSVRLRPMNAKEVGRNDVSDWECINENTIMFRNTLPERSMFPTAYTFDRVFRYDCSTKQVYEEAAKEVALSVVSGINSSIFAYGQTSSGKTYTMTGVTEYALADIYEYIQKHKERNFVVKFSAMEIYNEVVRDLLSPESPPLRLLDDPERGTVVERLTEETLRDWNHVRELLSVCEDQRQIGETSLNETSSRSHQIIRLIIESSAREYLGKDNSSTLTASVDFIDLAGSERASQALSAGARLKEGCHINRSLLTLGTVIRKLSKGRTGHIPYRDSKLTRILQCSLGGNARTAIICTISPARSHVEQSRNTLLFASTAKEVATNAQVNVVMSDKVLVKHLQRELARLESELKGPVLAPASCDSASILREKDLQIEKLQREIKELIQQRDVAQARLVDLVQVVSEDQSPVHWSEFNQPPKCYPSVWEDDQSTSASSGVADHHSLDAPVIRFNRSWYSTGHSESSLDEPYQQIPENPEDQFPPPGDSPRIFIKSSKSVAPDPRQVWEERTQETVVDFEENCREVRCIETEESNTGRNLESKTLPREDPEGKVAVPLTVNKNEAAIDRELVSSPKKEDKELKDDDSDHTYDALEQKLQDAHKTVNFHVNPHPDEPSPWTPEVVSSINRSSKLTRSRSCKATILTSSSCPSFQQAELYETTPNSVDKYSPERSEGYEWNFSAVNDVASFKRLYREDSHTSERSVSADELTADNIKSSAEEDNTIISTSADNVKEMSEIEYEKQLVDEQEKASEAHEYPHEEEVQEKGQEMERNSIESVKTVKDVGLDPVEEDSFETTSNWPVEFERQQREIIELWDTCNISLVHRTYFFLLFKGDPSDSIYMEVELRRLYFLKDNFSKGNLDKVTIDGGLDLSPSSSMKTLRREREMLCKQLQKRYSDEERVELYRKWGIPLESKQRKLRLAQLLWSDTKDMDRIRESAILVAKLVGLLEPGQAPKEMFGLSITPRHVARRSYSWKRHSISSIL